MSGDINGITLASTREAVSASISKVYGWMCFALFVTAGCAWLVGTSPELTRMFIANKAVFFGLIIVELLMVMGISFLLDKMSAATASALFILYAALNGLTMAVIFLVYTMSSIASVFAITACTFGVMSVYGYVTKRDLTTIGNLCLMALVGLIIAMVVNMFWMNNSFSLILSCAGVLIFVGLTAYDTQKVKEMLSGASDSETIGKVAIFGALALYLDFINLFLNLLRILGGRR